MTEILERRRRERLVARLPSRVEALGTAVELSAGRVPDVLTAKAAEVHERASSRLGLSGNHTVVALAGSTGSGKSSLFNALVGLDLATVGVRRPTTSSALACVWGVEGAAELLDWLGITRRNQIMRSSVLEDADDSDLRGLVLLDLPDHDSTDLSHRLEVDRLVDLVDLLVWVVDPQKYADAALHEDYLAKLTGHQGVMVVVLNQIDLLTGPQLRECEADLRRLLATDGLGDVPVLTTSATTSRGVVRLRALLAERVLKRQSASERTSADLDELARDLTTACGKGRVPELESAEVRRLGDALASAAGVDAVTTAVERSYRARGSANTGWPPLRLLRRLRPDPLRRLGLDKAIRSSRPDLVRSALPEPTPVQRAHVDAATRRVGDVAAGGPPALPDGWAQSVRAAARSELAELPDDLDQAIVSTDLGAGRTPWWWRAFGMSQWLLFAAAVVGAAWLILLAVNTYVHLPDPPTPKVWGWPLPTLLLVAGVVLALVLTLLARPFVAVAARRAAAVARKRLGTAVAAVGERRVLTPVRAELTRLEDTREAVAHLAKRR